MSEANAVATRLPEFSQHEPLTWFRRAETRFRLRGIKQATTRADYVLEALPETIFRRIGPWLDQQSSLQLIHTGMDNTPYVPFVNIYYHFIVFFATYITDCSIYL